MGVALTTLAALLLELSLTRLFSVVFYYHFAFLAISIALFGFGAGGVFSYIAVGWRGHFYGKLGWLASANCLAVLLALVFVLTRNGEPGYGTLALVYFFSALPFFFAGITVSLAIADAISRVDRVYFFDLIGAAAGCVLFVPFLNVIGGPNTVIAAAVLFAASSAIWHNLAGSTRGRIIAVGLALVLVALVVINTKSPLIDVRYAKGRALENERFVRWNSFSRVALAPEKGSGRMSIIIDADAATGIANFDIDNLTREQRRELLYQGPGFPYVIRPAAKTLIIGPGGGWDVARALASGSKDVTGVEINPIIATTIMRQRFPELSRWLYFRPEVKIVVEDGRSFIRRSTDKYEVLQATLVDTWASTAAGAFALSENNLYTTEAFYEYLSHLTETGVLAFSRWGFDPPRESLRLLSLARAALARLGEHDLWRHVMVVREGDVNGWGSLDTVLISREPFSPADLARATEALAISKLQRVYLPGDGAVNLFGQYLHSPNPAAFEAGYQYDISAVEDDRPFFFYSVQPRDLWEFVTRTASGSADYKINRAVPLLFSLVAISILATVIMLALPPLLLGTRLPRIEGAWSLLSYFLFLGAGYIMIQVALIQKFVLFLGHPTYALTVIIFSMLLASGLGSYFSRRLVAGSDRRLEYILASITGLIIALALAATPLTSHAVGLPLPLKVIMAVLLITPAAFLMGMPFPSGLARVEQRYHPSVRWAWSLNAASSVLGSASAVFLAIYLGLRDTLLIGGAMYVCALICVRLTEPARVTDVPLNEQPVPVIQRD